MPIDGPLMAIDGPHGTAMAIDELRWDLSTGIYDIKLERSSSYHMGIFITYIYHIFLNINLHFFPLRNEMFEYFVKQSFDQNDAHLKQRQRAS